MLSHFFHWSLSSDPSSLSHNHSGTQSFAKHTMSLKCKQCKATHLKLLPSLEQIEACWFSKVLSQSLWVLISISDKQDLIPVFVVERRWGLPSRATHSTEAAPQTSQEIWMLAWRSIGWSYSRIWPIIKVGDIQELKNQVQNMFTLSPYLNKSSHPDSQNCLNLEVWSSTPCVEPGVGLNDPCGSPTTQGILWFCRWIRITISRDTMSSPKMSKKTHFQLLHLLP